MEITGTIQKIFDQKQITDTFSKRDMVLVTDDDYPQTLLVEFPKDKGDKLNFHKEGDRVTVRINLRGREWTSPKGEVRYFTSISGWRIDKVEEQPSSFDQDPSGVDLPF
ncbi:MAG: DUF3127 domain-containing protein [Myxococcales bacterium FL481]|nr:MAG: DUF3127 domain-containing protein [Myxococcales bacterium FL481]